MRVCLPILVTPTVQLLIVSLFSPQIAGLNKWVLLFNTLLNARGAAAKVGWIHLAPSFPATAWNAHSLLPSPPPITTIPSSISGANWHWRTDLPSRNLFFTHWRKPSFTEDQDPTLQFQPLYESYLWKQFLMLRYRVWNDTSELKLPASWGHTQWKPLRNHNRYAWPHGLLDLCDQEWWLLIFLSHAAF